MKKVWTYKRKNRPGWYVGWYDDNGRRCSKQTDNKALAGQFALQIKHRLNSEIYIRPIKKPFDEVVTEYVNYKIAVLKLASESIRSIKNTLKSLKKRIGPIDITKLNQRHINDFIATRNTVVKSPTVNKDIRNLIAFVHWLIENHYAAQPATQIKWRRPKEAERLVRAINQNQLVNLLIAARKYQTYGDAWYLRVLLAVTTGLRQGDIERLRFSDIDFENNLITTSSKKTGKSMNRPLHSKAEQAIINYLQNIPEGRDELFVDKFTSGKWNRIRKRAGLPKLKFHDLRKAFASFIAQAGYSSSVPQYLLEHSTSNLTHKVYTDVSPVYKQAIESIPIPNTQAL